MGVCVAVMTRFSKPAVRRTCVGATERASARNARPGAFAISPGNSCGVSRPLGGALMASIASPLSRRRIVPLSTDMDEAAGLTRRTLLQRAGIAAAALCLLGAVGTPTFADSGWSDGEYWAFADRMQPLLDGDWNPSEGAYRLAGG